MAKEYTTLKRKALAVKYVDPETSFDEIREMVGDRALLEGEIFLEEGDWIVKLGDNEHLVLTDEDFQLNYSEG